MYVACPPQILVQDCRLASALCPGMLGRCEEPGLSGAEPCQVPVYGRPYLAWVAAVSARENSADASLSLGKGRLKVYKLMFSC